MRKALILFLFISIHGYGQTDPKFWRPETKEPPQIPNLIFIDGGNGEIEAFRFNADTTKFIITTVKTDSVNCRHLVKMSCSVYGCGCEYCIDCGKRLKK